MVAMVKFTSLHIVCDERQTQTWRANSNNCRRTTHYIVNVEINYFSTNEPDSSRPLVCPNVYQVPPGEACYFWSSIPPSYDIHYVSLMHVLCLIGVSEFHSWCEIHRPYCYFHLLADFGPPPILLCCNILAICIDSVSGEGG